MGNNYIEVVEKFRKTLLNEMLFFDESKIKIKKEIRSFEIVDYDDGETMVLKEAKLMKIEPDDKIIRIRQNIFGVLIPELCIGEFRKYNSHKFEEAEFKIIK